MERVIQFSPRRRKGPAPRLPMGPFSVARLAWEAMRTGEIRRGPGALRRIFALALFVPAMTIWECVTWSFLLADDVLFPAYRNVAVREPLFILGAPRSGTTFLHRLVAGDRDRFTTLTLWELIVAPSITQRYCVLGMRRLDSWVGSPMARLAAWLERLALRRLDTVHQTSLRDPEEDYLGLLPVGACFLMVLAFPFDEGIWLLSRFDTALDDAERRNVMRFYKRLVQRHLFVHGPNKRLLSKNPSFTSMMGSLRETFPEARFFACYRTPLEVTPSLLSSMDEGFGLFGYDGAADGLHERLMAMLESYYQSIVDGRRAFGPECVAESAMEELCRRPRRVVERAYGQFGWPVGAEFQAFLDAQEIAARSYRSRHGYSLERYGLTEALVRTRFHGVMEALGYEAQPDEVA